MRRHISLPVVGFVVASLLVGGTLESLAQRGGRGGGGRGGGGMSRGGGGGRSMGGGMRTSARPSVSRPASRPAGGSNFGGAGGIGGAGSVGRPGGIGGAGGVANRPATGGGRNDIGNRTNVGNNVNTGDRYTNIETDGDWNGGGGCWGGSCGCCHNPIAAGIAVGAVAGLTAAAIGSTVYALPSSCSTVIVNGMTYNDCGGTWYQPQFVGTETTYIVVDDPN
jgi:hypothetical protein